MTDDWRFSPTLTLQLGARWEYEGAADRAARPPRRTSTSRRGSRRCRRSLAGDVGALTGQSYPAGVMHDDWRGLQPRARHRVASGRRDRRLLDARRLRHLSQHRHVPADRRAAGAAAAALDGVQRSRTAPANPLTLANGFIVPRRRRGEHVRGRSAICASATRRTGRSWCSAICRLPHDHGDVSRHERRSPAAGVSAEHLSGRRGQPVSVVPRGLRLPHVERPLVAQRRAVAAAPAAAPRAGRERAVHARQGDRQRGAFTGVSLGGSAIAQDWLDLDAEMGRRISISGIR